MTGVDWKLPPPPPPVIEKCHFGRSRGAVSGVIAFSSGCERVLASSWPNERHSPPSDFPAQVTLLDAVPTPSVAASSIVDAMTTTSFLMSRFIRISSRMRAAGIGDAGGRADAGAAGAL